MYAGDIKRIKLFEVRKIYQNIFFVVCVLMIVILVILVHYMDVNEVKYRRRIPKQRKKGVDYALSKYLINTTNCKIPNYDHFHEEVRGFLKIFSYDSCRVKPLLSYIEKCKDYITLNINETLLPLYGLSQINCCYSKVTRLQHRQKPDDNISISECIPFEKSVVIVDPVIMVKCKTSSLKKVYSNVHAIISQRHVPKHKANIAEPNANLSVLLVGIDSISKLNLIRAMPQTYDFLTHNDFISLKGYTKIGLNTLPNLMGMLAGLTIDQLKKVCDYQINVDDCPNIWKRFSDLGYITGFGEDAASISTFNYKKKGFKCPPTDFYFRPYILAAMRLGVRKLKNMDYCAGPETEGERIMNLANDFQITLKKYPKFGLFWMNSFSHDDLNMPSAMDEKTGEFLETIYNHLDDTIFVFFSDHGFRFGEIRKTNLGWFEERTPFFYIHLPEIFKSRYPDKYNNILINSNRLTNAFDMYMTLQDVLLLTNKSVRVLPSEACPKCRSLFEEVNETRTCKDAGIDGRWCVCNLRTYTSPNQPTVQNAAHFLVEAINQMVASYEQGDKCSVYQLDKITYSGKSEILNELNQSSTELLLRIKLYPETSFEGAIELPPEGSNSKMRLRGSITRLDKYAPVTKCIKDPSLERLCYCEMKLARINKAVCFFSFVNVNFVFFLLFGNFVWN